MIHPSHVEERVAYARRDTRAEDRHDQHVLVGHVVFARQYLHGIDLVAGVIVKIGRFVLECASTGHLSSPLACAHCRVLKRLGELVNGVAAQAEQIGRMQETFRVASKQQTIARK